MTPAGSAEMWARVLSGIAGMLDTQGADGWIVGGCLRDALLGQPVWDVDVVVTADPGTVAEGIAAWDGSRGAVAPLARGARTHRVALRSTGGPSGAAQVDVSGLNGASLLHDLGARDFSINALALPVGAWSAFAALLAGVRQPRNADDSVVGELVDPLGGVRDLRGRRLRATSEHALCDDPIRVVRAARFAATLDFVLIEETRRQARAAAPGLAGVPVEAVAGELRLLMAHPAAARGIALLDEVEALGVVLPEVAGGRARDAQGYAALAAVERVPRLITMAGEQDVAAEGARALAAWLDERMAPGRSRRATLRWAALLCDGHAGAADSAQGARAAGAVVRRMGLGARERSIVVTCVAWRDAARELALVGGTVGVAARRYFAVTGEAGAEALFVAAARGLADATAAEETRWALLAGVGVLLGRYLTDRASLIPPPLVSGTEVIRASGLAAGSWVGEVLARVRSAQIAGDVVSPSEALRLALRLAAAGSHDGGATE